MRLFGALFILAAPIASPATAIAADPLPKSGAAKLAAYTVCRSLAIVDMGPVGSQSSAECTGIVKTRDGSKLLDNLAIRCLEESKARADATGSSGPASRRTATATSSSSPTRVRKAVRSNGSAGPASIKTSSVRGPGPSRTRRVTRQACSRSRSVTTRPGRKRRSDSARYALSIRPNDEFYVMGREPRPQDPKAKEPRSRRTR